MEKVNETHSDDIKEEEEHAEKVRVTRKLKLDKHGIPLSPQPSDDPDDPLNWSMKLKLFTLTQVSILAALGPLNGSIINPAFVPMAKDLHVSTIVASYQTTGVIALSGIAPFLWIPLANVYGRRPVYLATALLGFISALGSGLSTTFPHLLAARVFNGLSNGALSLCAGTVTDLFFVSERGRAMGLFAVILNVGPHIGQILGGGDFSTDPGFRLIELLIGIAAQFIGWQWCFFFGSIFEGVMFVIMCFCLPETLYIPDPEDFNGITQEKRTKKQISYFRRMTKFGRIGGRSLHWRQFFLPSIRMAKYPSVMFPAIYHALTFGFSSIMPSVTVAHVFAQHFHFTPLATGLAIGGSLSVGSFVGEFGGGIVVDAIMNRERRKRGGDVEPEVRLKAIWTGQILVPLGLLMYGFGVQDGAHFMVPIIGIGVGFAGAQIIQTVVYTYSAECYRPETNDTSQFFNLIRQEFGFTFGFYAILFGDRIGYQFTSLVYAAAGNVVAFIPIIWLMYRGQAVRERMGKPETLQLYGYSADGTESNEEGSTE